MSHHTHTYSTVLLARWAGHYSLSGSCYIAMQNFACWIFSPPHSNVINRHCALNKWNINAIKSQHFPGKVCFFSQFPCLKTYNIYFNMNYMIYCLFIILYFFKYHKNFILCVQILQEMTLYATYQFPKVFLQPIASKEWCPLSSNCWLACPGKVVTFGKASYDEWTISALLFCLFNGRLSW